MAKGQSRSAKEVIDAAIEDGAWWERACFFLLIAAAVVSLALAGYGALANRSWVSVGGGLGGTGTIGLLLRYANGVRREKSERRMSEIALSKAKTAQEAADILRHAICRPDRSKGDKS